MFMRHVVVECGRNTVITVTKRWKGPDSAPFVLPAYVGEARVLKLANDPLPTEIVMHSSFGSFFLGDLARNESRGAGRMMTKSKVHVDTKALILASVARVIECDDEDIMLTTNVPIGLHTSLTKAAMKEMLTGPQELTINGVKKKFTVRQVNVGTECAVAYMILCKRQGGTRRFIDLGSRMINFATVRNGRFIDAESGSLDYGCDTIKDGDLVHRVVSDLSTMWSDFNDWTYLIGGGAYKHSLGFLQYFPRLLCASYPTVTNALGLFEAVEASNAARLE